MKNYVNKSWYKRANFISFPYPKDIDTELVPMLNVFNNIPGVRTEYSCCGHGRDTWYMTFKCTSHYMAWVIFQFFNGYVTDKIFVPGEQYEVNISEETKPTNPFSVPETHIAIYCRTLGDLSETKRRKEYHRICEFFARFSPFYGWERIHQFDKQDI